MKNFMMTEQEMFAHKVYDYISERFLDETATPMTVYMDAINLFPKSAVKRELDAYLELERQQQDQLQQWAEELGKVQDKIDELTSDNLFNMTYYAHLLSKAIELSHHIKGELIERGMEKIPNAPHITDLISYYITEDMRG